MKVTTTRERVVTSLSFHYFANKGTLDLDPYGGCDLDGMIPLVYKQVARELAPKLTVIFRHQLMKGSFPACWRLANVVPVPKKFSSPHVGDYKPISNTPLLSKVFEKIVAGNWVIFWKVTVCFVLLSFRIGGALLTLSDQLQAGA